VRLEGSLREWHLVVEDDSPGLPPADLARVAEPYVRLDPAPGPSVKGKQIFPQRGN
jgi:signal transduction histidine kinase